MITKSYQISHLFSLKDQFYRLIHSDSYWHLTTSTNWYQWSKCFLCISIHFYMFLSIHLKTNNVYWITFQSFNFFQALNVKRCWLVWARASGFWATYHAQAILFLVLGNMIELYFENDVGLLRQTEENLSTKSQLKYKLFW